MGQKLPPREMELYRRCDEILHYIWDPIGIAGTPGARDEYHSYLPQFFGLVKKNSPVDEIMAYLDAVSEQSMGIEPDTARSHRAAELVLEWRDWIGRNE